MAQLTGKLGADFSQFYTEAQKATAYLTDLSSGAGKAGAAFEAMAGRFNGSKVITEATLMASVFERAGGAAKFTTAELEAMGKVGAEAADKMHRLGLEVPAGIQRIADAAKNVGAASADSTAGVNSLHGALNQFDGVLAALGVHLGPEIRGLGELGDASGKSASEIGLLGVAGLAVGAAMGGWKIGRAVAEYFELDTTIAKATATLLGWGSVADQVAGSKADQLAEASKRIGFEVLSLSTAIEINTGWVNKWRDNATISAGVVAAWRAELEKVGPDLGSLTADLKSHNFSLKDLAERYHVSVEALQFFTRETQAAAAAEKEASAATQDANRRKLKGLADEIAANKEARKAADDAAALDAKAALDSNTRWAETAALKMRVSGTTTERVKADIDAWVQHEIQSHVRAKTDTADFYAWLGTQSGLMQQAEDQRRILSDSASRASFEKRKQAADDWLQFVMAHVSEFTNADIDQAVKRAAAATQEWAHFGQAAATALDATKAKIEAVTAAAEKARAAMMAMGNTLDLASAAQDPEIMNLLKQGYSLKNAEAINLGRQQGFTPQLYDEKGNPENSPSKGEGVPGYAPSTSAPAKPAGGNITIAAASQGGGSAGGGGVSGSQTINLVVDGRVLATVVSDQLTKELMQGRLLPTR